jgi:hypothetical protein
MTTREISNSDNIIDSRDIIERIEELESLRDGWMEEHNIPESEFGNPDNKDWMEWDNSSDADELKALQSLQDELEGYCDDWKYGVTLIRDSYFEEYAEELCKDIGEIPSNLPWYIASHIDWDGVADELKIDYTSADFDGVTFWAR